MHKTGQSDEQQGCRNPKQVLKKSMFLVNSDVMLAQRDTDRVCTVLCASMYVRLCEKKTCELQNIPSRSYLTLMLQYHSEMMAKNSQQVMKTNHKSRSPPFRNFTLPISFEAAITENYISVVISLVKRKNCRMRQVYTTTTLIGNCVQPVCMAWRLLFKRQACLVCIMRPRRICGVISLKLSPLFFPSPLRDYRPWISKRHFEMWGGHYARYSVLIPKPQTCQF